MYNDFNLDYNFTTHCRNIENLFPFVPLMVPTYTYIPICDAENNILYWKTIILEPLNNFNDL